MTAQPPLPLTPAGAVPIGAAAAMVADDDGGRVFIRGELCFVWDGEDEVGRRLAAVQLVRIKAASLLDVAAAFGVATVTLWRWRKELDAFEEEPPAANHELFAFDNVVVTPHTGAHTTTATRRMAEMAIDNLIDGLTSGSPSNLCSV